MSRGALVGAIDQGTSSTRFLIFSSETAEVVTYHQQEINHIIPRNGWAEIDPLDILESVRTCISAAVGKMKDLGINISEIKCIGITTQRETTIVWDKATGEPLYNAILWLDLRTATTAEELIARAPQQDKNYFRPICGLPITTTFSAIKLRWLLDHSETVQNAVSAGRCMFGTVDTWLLWKLTGGPDGGKHFTDVTCASRTMLMNLHTLQWDETLCQFFNIPCEILPKIQSSSEIYGLLTEGPLKGLPISGILADQQSALVGQACFKVGQAKNTYGTASALLFNTGTTPIQSKTGVLTTVAYKLGKSKPAVYALEGSVALAGAIVKFVRDNLGIIKTSSQVGELAAKVDSTEGCYFVPAFSGLYCPHWDSSARGIICGLSQFTTKEHICRAALEAVCFQTKELLEAMYTDSGISLSSLQVDGGMTVSNICMQLQADILGINVVRPHMMEKTALGAAMAAAAADGVNIWKIESQDLTTDNVDVFQPSVTKQDRDKRYKRWKMAVKKSLHWAEEELTVDED